VGTFLRRAASKADDTELAKVSDFDIWRTALVGSGAAATCHMLEGAALLQEDRPVQFDFRAR